MKSRHVGIKFEFNPFLRSMKTRHVGIKFEFNPFLNSIPSFFWIRFSASSSACIYIYFFIYLFMYLFIHLFIYIFLCWFDMLCLCNKTLTWTCDFSIQLMEIDTPSKLGWVKWLVVLDIFWWSTRSWFHNIDPAAGLKPPVKRICDDLFLRNTRFGGFMILKVLLGGSSHLSG